MIKKYHKILTALLLAFFVTTNVASAAITFPGNGGTGWGFPGGIQAHTVIIGNGTNPLATTSPSNAGYVLTSNGLSLDPTFQPVAVPAGGGGINATTTVSQVGHGFSSGQWVGLTGSSTQPYALTNAVPGGIYQGVGVIESVPDADHFILQTAGDYVDTNLIPGMAYYLSASSTALGTVVGYPPTTAGYVSAPVSFAKTATAATIQIGRPSTVASGGAIAGINVGNDYTGSTYLSTSTMVAQAAIIQKNLASNYVRIALPSWNSAVGIYNMRAMALYYKSLGYRVSYGITGLSSFQNSTTYASWKSQLVGTEAVWAAANGIQTFYIGNEEDWFADLGQYGTITRAQIQADVLTMATTLKTAYPTMNIVYATAQGTVIEWHDFAFANGFGALDTLYFNMYDTLASFEPNIKFFSSEIGSKYAVSEWNSNFGYYDMIHSHGYTDALYAADLGSRAATLKKYGINAYFFALTFGGNTVGPGQYNILTNTGLLLPGAVSAFGGGSGNQVLTTPLILGDNQVLYFNDAKTSFMSSDITNFHLTCPTFGNCLIAGRTTITSTQVPTFNLAYDSTHNTTVNVSSSGLTNFDSHGSGAGFTFADKVSIASSTIDSSVALNVNGAMSIENGNGFKFHAPNPSANYSTIAFNGSGSKMTTTWGWAFDDGGITSGSAYYNISAPPGGLIVSGITGIGTSTPYYGLTVASTTGPQLALSTGAGVAQVVFRNDGTNFDISTTTIAGTATTSTTMFRIAMGGFGTTTVKGLNINAQATSTSNVGFNITTGCYAIAGTCLSGSGGGGTWGSITGTLSAQTDLQAALDAKLSSYDSWTHPAAGQSATTSLMQFNGNASSTLLSASTVFANYFMSTSTATSTFTGGIATNLLNVTSTIASSTFANGINLTAGCFSIGGTCLTQNTGTVTSVGVSSSGSITIGSTPVTTSGTITADLNLANSNTWTAKQNFANSSTTLLSAGYAKFGSTASSTFGTDGRLGILTTSALTHDLEVNGTAYVGNKLTVNGDFSSEVGISYVNTLQPTTNNTGTIGNSGDFYQRLFTTYASSTYASFTNASTTNLIMNGQSFNNLLGSGLSNSSGALTIGTGAITNAMLANSTISGVALGSTLAALTATDSTLTFSGSYTGNTARTVGINLAQANTWTGLQQFNGNASTTGLTVSGSTYLATTAGSVGIGTTTPVATLNTWTTSAAGIRESIMKASVSDAQNDAFFVYNATSADGQFLPAFGGFQNTSSAKSALRFSGFITAANDTGTTPVINFDNLITTSITDPTNNSTAATVISTRPLFDFESADISKLIIMPTGFIGVSTTTPAFFMDIASTSAGATFRPQLGLTDTSAGTNLKHWTLESKLGSFYISTSSDVYATSTRASLAILTSGVVELGNYANCNGTSNALGITSGQLLCDSLVSDQRLKKDIAPIYNGLDTVLALRPVTFMWKDLTNHNTSDPREQDGFIAQEVTDIIPSAVGESPDGYLTLDKTALIAPMVQAIQQLNTKITNIQVGKFAKSAQDNWQDILIGLLILGFIYQQVQIKKIKKSNG